MKSPEGAALFGQMMSKMAEAGGAGAAGMEIDKDAMMQMMNGFTVLRLTNLLGTAGVKFTKEQLLGINAQLNKIKKP